MAEGSGVSRLARNLITFYLRLALGVDFLSAVADRFGLWGPPGSKHVTWGSFSEFIAFVGRVDPFAPARTAPTVAWVVTALELLFGALLILGLFTRATALLSGILLGLFAVGMSLGMGAKSAFDASMFTSSAAAFALAGLGPSAWSIDGRRRKKRLAPPAPSAPPAPPARPSEPVAANTGGQNKPTPGS